MSEYEITYWNYLYDIYRTKSIIAKTYREAVDIAISYMEYYEDIAGIDLINTVIE